VHPGGDRQAEPRERTPAAQSIVDRAEYPNGELLRAVPGDLRQLVPHGRVIESPQDRPAIRLQSAGLRRGECRLDLLGHQALDERA
jgi:hypothetical protein